jgi:hypothetical protein
MFYFGYQFLFGVLGNVFAVNKEIGIFWWDGTLTLFIRFNSHRTGNLYLLLVQHKKATTASKCLGLIITCAPKFFRSIRIQVSNFKLLFR